MSVILFAVGMAAAAMTVTAYACIRVGAEAERRARGEA